MDCYFYVVVWEGRVVREWRTQGLHESEEYSYLKDYFDRPLIEVE